MLLKFEYGQIEGEIENVEVNDAQFLDAISKRFPLCLNGKRFDRSPNRETTIKNWIKAQLAGGTQNA